MMGGEVRMCQPLAGASGSMGDMGATGQTGVTGGWTLLPMNEVDYSRMPWRRVHRTSVGWCDYDAPLLAGVSGSTGETGASGQTGVTGGRTLLASLEANFGRTPWRFVIVTSDGRWCQRLTSIAGASGFTGDTGATGQMGVTGGWTLLPLKEAIRSLMLGRCPQYKG